MKQNSTYRRGFTLVEIAIVLVVIGLLSGGVLVGRALIHTTKLNHAITESQKYRAATVAFKDQYRALPGDMRNAVRYWGPLSGGTADGVDASCLAATLYDGQLTCNGDGNGRLGENTVASEKERVRFWQHLSNAGLIEGFYTGLQTLGPTMFAPGVNVPASRLTPASWSVNWFAFSANTLTLGLADGTEQEGEEGWGGAYTAEDAQYIDTKADDGSAYTGNIIGYHIDYESYGCVSSPVSGYVISNTEQVCHQSFLMGL